MTIHKQDHEPRNAAIGDAWTDGKSFKRVLSRGRAWENVNLGSTHPDEVDHDEQERKRAEAEQQQSQVPVSGSVAGKSAQDSGEHGKAATGDAGQGGKEPAEVTHGKSKGSKSHKADESEG